MNKTDFRKSGLVSAMLVALICVIVVPAVSADQDTSQNPTSYFGEGVGSGVQATYYGGYYFGCWWVVARWQGGCESMVGDLSFTLWADGSPMSSSTPNNDFQQYYGGPLSTMAANAASVFYDSRLYPIGYFIQNSGTAQLPT